MKRNYTFVFALLSLFFTVNAKGSNNSMIANEAPKNYFIENKGQWPDEVLYLTQIKGLNAWITKSGVLYDFYKIEKVNSNSHIPHQKESFGDKMGHKVKINYVGADIANVKTESFSKLSGYHNYFLGNDPSKWASNVGLYNSVKLNNVYNGVDVHYYFDNGLLRYDFILQPNANPSSIKLLVDGANSFNVNSKGELTYFTRFGEVAEGKIYAYQIVNGKKKEVKCHYKKHNSTVSLNLGEYDKNLPLVIDPLVYSTFIGAGFDDRSVGLAIDNNDNVTIAGTTSSLTFPAGPNGAYDITHGGNGTTDAFVTQFNSSGSNFNFSTFIGGTGGDDAFGIVMDVSGNIYITGATNSGNFPTLNAYDNTQNGNNDVFVTKLNSTGTALVYSTFIGGASGDWALGIALDGNNNACVTGYTESTDYPTVSAYSSTHGGGTYDVFVSKLNHSGNSLSYSTFIGGNSYEFGTAITIDPSNGIAYVTGYTNSSNFPTSNAYQSTKGAFLDVFVFKLNAAGNSLSYSTFIGGAGDDVSLKIKLLPGGAVTICGYTNSSDFPTNNAYDNTYNGGNDVFYSVLNFNNLFISSYLGGTGDDHAVGLELMPKVVNSATTYDAIITGNTYSNNFPLTSDAYDNSHNGDRDVFVSRIELTVSPSLLYSTYFGGSLEDRGIDIAVKSNNVYFTGRTNSSDFPSTSNVYDNTHNGSFDAYVSVISFCPVFNLTVSNNANTLTVGQTGANYQWIDCNNSNAPISGATSQSFTPAISGNYAVIVTQNGCSDTSNCTAVTLTGINELNTSGLKIYPNPATDNINLQLNQSGVLEVYSIDGKLIESVNINTYIYKLNIQHYNKGMYMLRFIGLDGNSHQSKFIKE